VPILPRLRAGLWTQSACVTGVVWSWRLRLCRSGFVVSAEIRRKAVCLEAEVHVDLDGETHFVGGLWSRT
jgi:hypothetical protein